MQVRLVLTAMIQVLIMYFLLNMMFQDMLIQQHYLEVQEADAQTVIVDQDSLHGLITDKLPRMKYRYLKKFHAPFVMTLMTRLMIHI